MPGPYIVNAFMLAPALPQGAAISQLFVGPLIFLSATLALIAFLVIFALIRYRDRPGAPKAQQSFGPRKLEIIWMAIPICRHWCWRASGYGPSGCGAALIKAVWGDFHGLYKSWSWVPGGGRLDGGGPRDCYGDGRAQGVSG